MSFRPVVASMAAAGNSGRSGSIWREAISGLAAKIAANIEGAVDTMAPTRPGWLDGFVPMTCNGDFRVRPAMSGRDIRGRSGSERAFLAVHD